MKPTFKLVLSASAILSAGPLIPAAATAQEEDYERIVTIMRACSQIGDIVARVTCYDNNIQPRDGGSTAASAVPSSPVREAPPRHAGFAAEMLPRKDDAGRQTQMDEFQARVTASERLEPGIYVITLEDGAQWRFADSATTSYAEPQAGDTIRLERGALGSVYLHFDSQEALRVRRIR